VKKLWTRENLLAIGLVLLVVLLLIMTADTRPPFIYQQF
jgi:hypothetical protein